MRFQSEKLRLGKDARNEKKAVHENSGGLQEIQEELHVVLKSNKLGGSRLTV